VSSLWRNIVQELQQIVLELHLTFQVLHTVEIYCKYVVVGRYGVVPELAVSCVPIIDSYVKALSIHHFFNFQR
jgi:hypothetical protein